nr:immunoglobulin heavy chain junction region [Macaca mulatta]MOW82028.1 immunoglobulin heavy chain junction region [Macaca mulatta]
CARDSSAYTYGFDYW